MEKILDSVPEHLKCPICIEMPEDKVFQCKDGHIICGGCYSQLSECPQCRNPYGKDGIRNRHMEEMLDELAFDCAYHDSGCKQKLNRKTVRGHIESCPFNNSRKISINICKLIGHSDCPFSVTEGSISEAIQHLQQDHNIITSDSPRLKLNLGDFSEQTLHTNNMYPSLGNSRTEWDIILNLKEEGCAFLILTIFNEEDETVSWIPLRLKYDDGDETSADAVESINEIQFIISNMSGTDHAIEDWPYLKWSITPVDIFKAEKLLPNLYPFRIPASLLTNYTENGSLKVTYQVRKEGSGAIASTSSGSNEDPVIYITSGMTTLNVTPSAPPLTLPSPKRRLAPPPPIPPPNRKRSPELSLVPPSTPPYLCGPALDGGAQFPSTSTSEQPAFQVVGGRKGRRAAKKEHIRSVKEMQPLPTVNCNICNTLIDKVLFQCLQCKNFSICRRCFKLGEHKHLFGAVRTTDQYNKLVGKGEPLLPVSVELPTWWAELDVETKSSLKSWLELNRERCTNSGCRREGHVVGVCLECPAKLCKACRKHDFHSQHVVAVTGTSRLRSKDRDDVPRKFLLQFQRQRNMSPFL